MKRYRHLTREQRYSIQRYIENGLTQAEVALKVDVHPSTICRELKRNSNTKGIYNARYANVNAIGGKSRINFSNRKRKIRGVLEEIVIEKLGQRWSPQQISERLKLEGRKSVSHEAIYRYVYMDKRQGGVLFQTLRLHGRRRRRIRRNRLHHWTDKRKFIDKRPKRANTRQEFGHWERDLVCGKRGTASLLTIVDRKSRYTVIRKVGSHSYQEVGDRTYEVFRKNKLRLPCHTLTNDNGIEFRKPGELEADLEVPIFFTNPYHSWERGTNENTNGLLRQFFPKSTDLTGTTETEISQAEALLNTRPRKILGYRTPEEILFSKDQKLFKEVREYQREIRRREESYYDSCPCCRTY